MYTNFRQFHRNWYSSKQPVTWVPLQESAAISALRRALMRPIFFDRNNSTVLSKAALRMLDDTIRNSMYGTSICVAGATGVLFMPGHVTKTGEFIPLVFKGMSLKHWSKLFGQEALPGENSWGEQLRWDSFSHIGFIPNSSPGYEAAYYHIKARFVHGLRNGRALTEDLPASGFWHPDAA